jgi:general secretion pathway protein A
VYLKYYHFKKPPFNITPDPEFLSLSRCNREAMASLTYGIENRKGFTVITGEVGVGKTTILRSYLERIDRVRLKIVYIINSNVTFKGLLKTIFLDLDRKTETDDVFEMVNRFHYLLIEEYRQGHNVALIIDEAQNMPIETLENLRMLSNLETSTDKLLQIVLVGQPELERILDSSKLRQLKQRIAIHFRIPPFTEKESLAYIKYRLAKAGKFRSAVFTRGALREIVREAKGIPRILNILCDNSLLTGMGYRVRRVNARIAREAIADFEGHKVEKTSPSLRWIFTSAVVFIVTTGFFWFSPLNDFLPYLGKSLSAIYRHDPAQEESNASTEKFAVLKHSAPIKDGSNTKIKEGPNPVVQEKTTPLPGETFPKLRIVEEGDNLYSLTKDIYGFTNHRLIAWIKQKNPNLKNINKLQAGDLILFPEIDQSMFRSAR